jgi:hypothetical protein
VSRAKREVSIGSLTTCMPLVIFAKRGKIDRFLIEILRFNGWAKRA